MARGQRADPTARQLPEVSPGRRVQARIRGGWDAIDPVRREADVGLEEQSPVEKVLSGPNADPGGGAFDGLPGVGRRPMPESIKPVPVRVEAPGTHEHILAGPLGIGTGPGRGGHLFVPGRRRGKEGLGVPTAQVMRNESGPGAPTDPWAPRGEGIQPDVDGGLVRGPWKRLPGRRRRRQPHHPAEEKGEGGPETALAKTRLGSPRGKMRRERVHQWESSPMLKWILPHGAARGEVSV
jgi:hypothetical protein